MSDQRLNKIELKIDSVNEALAAINTKLAVIESQDWRSRIIECEIKIEAIKQDVSQQELQLQLFKVRIVTAYVTINTLAIILWALFGSKVQSLF